MDNFTRAVQIVLVLEGLLTDDKFDPGGKTKYGISQAYHPDIDVANLTRDQAIEIYRTEYWAACSCDKMEWRWALCVFNFAVNISPQWARTSLQSAVGTKPDGNLGALTLHALASCDQRRGLASLQRLAVEHYEQSPNYSRYRDGWLERTFEVLIDAMTP